jgi:6-phosphogluconate dehydrogenase
MNVGVVGLGRMGLQIARKLAQAQFTVIGFDPNSTALPAEDVATFTLVSSLTELAQKVEIVWLMVPAGDVVDNCLYELTPHLQADAIVIDGGNSLYKDSIRRAQFLESKGLHFLDCGTSGGTHGLTHGFSLMVGGNEAAYARATPVFKTLAAAGGFGLLGPSGAGHFVKMVHNGIEYGILQAYAEGLHVLREGQYKNLDLAVITDIWQNGSIIRSWILALAHEVLKTDQQLTSINGSIDENKTGRWTLDAAQESKIPTPVIQASLDARAWSRQTGGNFGTKVVAMLRNAFGGHSVKKSS